MATDKTSEPIRTRFNNYSRSWRVWYLLDEKAKYRDRTNKPVEHTEMITISLMVYGESDLVLLGLCQRASFTGDQFPSSLAIF